MSKITAEWGSDYHDQAILILRKKRGKISIGEIEEFLRYTGSGKYQGHWAILINASEASCGGSGWMDEYDDPGDTVCLYQIEEGDCCPVCGAVTPLLEYCPNCGEKLKESQTT